MKQLLLIIVLFFGFFSTSIAQKSLPTSPQKASSVHRASPTCPLSVSIQDNIPAAVCSELLKTMVAVTPACTDTNAVSYSWSSTAGGVFSTSRTTTFNLPEYLVATPVTFTVTVVEGTETASANYTITVNPRPSRPTLTPFGTIVLCDNNFVTLTSSACTGGSTTIWSNGASGVSSISVPPTGGTYYSVACYKNGCISDSTAAAALITGLVTSPPTTTSRVICEGTAITTGNGLQADLVNCNNGASGTYTYTGGTVGYDAGRRSTGGVDPSINIPTLNSIIKKVSVSITWRKQKGGYENSCGVGDTETWPYHNETQFRVKSPSGKIVTLVNTNTYGGSNNPTITTVFEDGGTPINFYSPPVSGTFAPAQPLSGFIGENPTGTWTLLPYDAVGKDPLCVSGFSVTFSEAQNGTLTWWDAPTGGNQVGTGSEFIPTNTSAGTYTYYAQGQCVRGCPSVRTAASLTIRPTPPAPVISVNVPDVNGTKSICYGESITLTATGCTGTVKWNSNQNGTNFATGATYTFTPSGSNFSNTTHSFTAICESSNLCKSVNSNSLSVLVKYKPAQPTISGPGSSICSNTNITLTASACSGGTLGWTGNRFGSSINFVLTNAVNIKVACTVSGCTSDSSNVYSITPLPRPNPLTVNASQVQALCYGSSVTLSASACAGTVKWTGNLSGSPITVTPLTSRNYKASCLGTNGCSSDSSTALTIIVLPKTKPTITGSTFICGTGTGIPVTLTATGCSGVGETVMWRNEDTGLTYTETISQTKTFRAVCIRGGYCVSDSSDIFTVQYRNKPSQPTITPPQNTTICQGSSVSLTASACAGGTLGWTGGLSGQTVSVFPNVTKSYKVACLVNGCLSDSSSVVTITVNPTPVISVSANKNSICSGDSAVLILSGCTGTISWSNGATTSIIKVSPATNTTYTATCTLGFCSANQSVSITALSTPNVTASGILQCGQTVTLTANNVPVGSSIQWRKDGVDIANATNSTLVINSAGSYDFRVGATATVQSETTFIYNNDDDQKIQFIDRNRGFYLISSTIKKTIDGGNTWNNIYVGTTVKDFYFSDLNNGWAIESHNILRTIDGGNTWTIYNTSFPNFNLRKISFANNNVGIIATDNNKTISTSNGGTSWTLNSASIFSTGVPNPINDIKHISNSNTVFAIGNYGYSGLLSKSTDNGVTWSNNTIFNNTSLQNIEFTNSTNGCIGSDYGTILKTNDGGNTWSNAIVYDNGSDYLIREIDFIDNQIGYAIGSRNIFKTSNGGMTWNKFREYNTSGSGSNKIDFVSEDNGWYIYAPFPYPQKVILTKISTPQCPTKPIVIAPPQRPNAPIITPPTNSTICQGSSITLSATGCTGGTFAWTGGLTGTSISVSPSSTRAYKVACTLNTCVSDSSSAVTINVTPAPMFSVSADKTSICTGESATITATGCTGTLSWTGGATTTAITVSPTINTTYAATCTSGSCSSNQSVTITALLTPFVTTSGILECRQPVTLTANNVPVGASIHWRKDGVDIANATNSTLVINSTGNYDFKVGGLISIVFNNTSNNASTSLFEVKFFNANVGFYAVDNTIRKTTNGGLTWTDIYSLTDMKGITFIDVNNLWAISSNTIAKSTNGGVTWSTMSNVNYPFQGTSLSKIYFKNINEGMIFAFNKVLYTTDGGVTWMFGSNFSGVPAKFAYMPNSSNLFAAGSANGGGVIQKSVDNGVTWTNILSQPSEFNDIQFINQNVGWIVRGYTSIYRTVDGGNNWSFLSMLPQSMMVAPFVFDFVSEQIGYALTSGKLYKTIDGGTTWSIIDNAYSITGSNGGIIGLNITSENNGWYAFRNIGSNGGNILKKISTPQCSTTPKLMTNICCSTFETIKSGSWIDPTTWSCNRAPTATDDVIINTGHTITNTVGIIRAKSLNYKGGQLQISSTSNLILGN